MDLRPFMERWHMLPPSGGVMLVAVSGGRDSVCLLHYLAVMPRDFTVAAAHLNHGQRPTAGRDAAFVEELCRELDVPLTVERADVPALARERGVGLEEAGRMARYDFFRRTADRLGAQRIATAHHAADQAETVVLNLVRGTGMQGLAGIPPVRGRIVRPLLETSREEIETYLETHRLSHVEDETNRDTALRRNLLRREVMPRLAELHDGAAANICRTAELLRQELQRNEWDRSFHQDTHRLSEEILHREALPREDRSQRLLNLERERTQFYADQCGGIQFDYDLLSGRVTVTNHYASAAERTQVLDFDHGEGLNFCLLYTSDAADEL